MAPELRRRAEEWLAADPDFETRAELRDLLAGDPDALRRRFDGRLAFGTAGIRGPMGAGPTRMSRVLVRIVAAALAARLLQEHSSDPCVAVGYDARHRSSDFAVDTARVLAGRGVRVTMLPAPLPTPVLAFAVKHLAASAGVMVTASHNPRGDNGYKVYWRGGAQLAPPTDAEISRIIDRTAPLAEHELAPAGHRLIETAGDDLVQAYLDAVLGLLAPGGPRRVRIAYTPLHGVGAETLLRAVARAGFETPSVVAEQADPDGDFPTAPFPNPEEPGVLDRLLRLAAQCDADVALAHDPDADRLAVAVPDGARWRVLTGDETGCLLAEHLLGRAHPREAPAQPREAPAHPRGARGAACRRRLVISTVVSSRLAHKIAQHHGADWVETLTGFKWIMQARSQRAASHELVLGYEDALGYAVGEAVNDKDGIGAALVVAEMVAGLRAQGRTVASLLDELHRLHGVHVTGQRSIRFEPADRAQAAMTAAMAGLREAPPSELAGEAVTAARDLAAADRPTPAPASPQDGETSPAVNAISDVASPASPQDGETVAAAHDSAAGFARLPPADAVILLLDGIGARVSVRPSGTEPKLKIYAEVATAPGDPGSTGIPGIPDDSQLRDVRAEAAERLRALLDDAVRLLAPFGSIGAQD